MILTMTGARTMFTPSSTRKFTPVRPITAKNRISVSPAQLCKVSLKKRRVPIIKIPVFTIGAQNAAATAPRI